MSIASKMAPFSMKRLLALAPLTGLLLLLPVGGSAVAAAHGKPTATLSVTSGVFNVQFSQSDPEEITSFSWNGSPNLTNTWANPGQCAGNPDLEFFGNAWGLGPQGLHPVLVGGGSGGTWISHSSAVSTKVKIDSAANGCPPQTSGIPVSTTYQFPSSGNTFTVQRKFSFQGTPFTSDLKPYIPRLSPGSQYTYAYYPTTAGTLATVNEGFCGFGCEFKDWNGSWVAMTNWFTGQGMILQRTSPPAPVALWLEQDGGSMTSTASVLLLQPPGGFTGSVVEAESMCFFGSWNPSLTLPAGC